MAERSPPPLRSDYRAFRPITLRWIDNDVFGHVNNVVYYSFFDTTVCSHLIEQDVFHPTQGDVIGMVVESRCTYYSPVSYPERIEGALRVDRIGNSSITYGVAVFRVGEDHACAAGPFTHVYVDRASQRPVPLPPDLRRVAEALLCGSE